MAAMMGQGLVGWMGRRSVAVMFHLNVVGHGCVPTEDVHRSAPPHHPFETACLAYSVAVERIDHVLPLVHISAAVNAGGGPSPCVTQLLWRQGGGWEQGLEGSA